MTPVTESTPPPASGQPHPGGQAAAINPQDQADPPALEARRAPGAVLVATFERTWDHDLGGPVAIVRPAQ